MLTIHCFVDPACPWTWITSRWLVSVAPERNLEIRWRALSLTMRDGGKLSSKIPERYRQRAQAARLMSVGALRLFEAVRADRGEEAVGELYTAIGGRLYQSDRPLEAQTPPSDVLDSALNALGLDEQLARSASDARWDPVVAASLEEVCSIVGRDVMSPAIVLDGEVRRGLSGPIVSPAPQGEAALRLWDAFRPSWTSPPFLRLAARGPCHRSFPPWIGDSLVVTPETISVHG